MRILVFSDIHNNLEALIELRRVESNEYDALIVAGDIGNEIAAQFFRIADSFNCPTFYVHGNWDDEQSYSAPASTRCTLLHHQIEFHSGYHFTGFSGHPWAWGKNPEYQALLPAIAEKHSKTLETYEQIKAEAVRLAGPIEMEFQARGKLLLLKRKRAKSLPSVHRKRREKLRDWRSRELEAIHSVASEFRQSPAFQAYESDLRQCSDSAQCANRKGLLELIKRSNVPPSRLILVTHERQHKLADDGITPLLHVYGHRHRFEFTKFKGSHYLNGSSLDPTLQMTDSGLKRTPARYCRVEIHDQTIAVTQHVLKHAGPRESAFLAIPSDA